MAAILNGHSFAAGQVLVETQDRQVRLDAFLLAQAALPAAWGVTDCTLMPADWIVSETGQDPAAPYRGRYASADECADLIARSGGFMSMIDWQMDACGFIRTQAPRPGDVGVVEVPLKMLGKLAVARAVSAIRTRDLWAVRGQRGLCFQAFSMAAAWSIPARAL